MQSSQDRLLQGDFRISPVLFIISNIFLLAGAGISIIDDAGIHDYLSVVSNSVVFLLSALCTVLYFTRQMTANVALGTCLYAAMANFVLEFIQSMLIPGNTQLVNQVFFLILGIVVFQGIAGFIINRWGSVIVGIVATTLLVWASLTLKDPYFGQINLLLIVIVVGYGVIVIYYRMSLDNILKRLKETNQDLLVQRNEADKQRIAAESNLQELQKAQKKIVSQEKLASLGAMTAGIAHEIKNPLNFITNFSESSLELMAELKAYLDKYATGLPAADKEEVEYLLGELQQNMKDICSHGKRGDHIVKSMLMHSRNSNSTITREDVNMLAEECLNLSFHGLRAQDSEFQSDRVFKPDPTIGNVDMVRGDLGRVLLNMCNNAFYSVHQKRRKSIPGYKPQVAVRTLNQGDNYVVVIEDNGMGMSPEVQAKLFTPFYTTKPTGEGTGLGLSMSHEIVVQEHGGEIRVESEEGFSARFILTIPKRAVTGAVS